MVRLIRPPADLVPFDVSPTRREADRWPSPEFAASAGGPATAERMAHHRDQG